MDLHAVQLAMIDRHGGRRIAHDRDPLLVAEEGDVIAPAAGEQGLAAAPGGVAAIREAQLRDPIP